MQSFDNLHPVASALRELAIDLDPGAMGLVARDLFEVIPMQNYGRKATLLIEDADVYKGDAAIDDRRAMGAKAQSIRGGKTDDLVIEITDHALSYFCDHLEIIDDQLPGDGEVRAAKRLRRTLLVAQEKRAADLLFQASTGWTSSTVAGLSGGGGAKWNAATGTPLSDLQVIQELVYDASGGFMPDTLVLPWKIVRAIGRNNEARRVLIGSGSATSVSRDEPMRDDAVISGVAGVLGIPEASIIVPGFRRNTANPAQTASLAEIWTDNVWMGVLRGADYETTRSGVKMAPLAAADFRYSEIEEDVEEKKNPKGRELTVGHIHDFKVIETSLGYLATDAL